MADHPRACDAWQERLAEWVVAKIEPADEAALGVHLAGCDTCRAEADRLWAVAAVALGAEPAGHAPVAADEVPPATLGPRIFARVARERRQRWLTRAAVAVAAAAAVVAGVLVMDTDRQEPLRGEELSFARGEGTAVVAADPGGSLVEVAATGLDPDVTYALWLTPPGGGYADRVPAGTFRPNEQGRVDARLHSAIAAEDVGRIWATTPDDEIALDTEP